MQKPKTGKFSIFSPLGVKLGSLAGRVGLIQFPVGSDRVELKICSIRLESSWKCEQSDFESSRIQNVNPKLDSMISLFFLKLNDVLKLSFNHYLFLIFQKHKLILQMSNFREDLLHLLVSIQ